jgi:hypothetical protein
MKIYELPSVTNFYIIGSNEGNIKSIVQTLNEGLSNEIELDAAKPTNEKYMVAPSTDISWTTISSLGSVPFQKTNYNDSIIIINGNEKLGFNDIKYYELILEKINKALSKTNTYLFFIRGNNDNPSFFKDELINLSNVKSIPDYSLIKISSKNILCVGGGISINRSWKMKHQELINSITSNESKKIYWEDEAPFFDGESLKELKNTKIDYVITHIAPTFSFPDFSYKEIPWIKADKALIDDLENARLVMDNIYDYLIKNHNKPEAWIYGHYNIANVETRAGINFISITNGQVINPLLTTKNKNALDSNIRRKIKMPMPNRNVDVFEGYQNIQVDREREAPVGADEEEIMNEEEMVNENHYARVDVDADYYAALDGAFEVNANPFDALAEPLDNQNN